MRIPQQIISWLCVLLVGCSTPVIPDDPRWQQIDNSRLPPADLNLSIPGLEPCTTSADRRIHLNSQQPVTVLAHGCFGSSARFRALAEVFAFHGQKAICFAYNDRDSLTKSSTELINSLEALNKAVPGQPITLIGHSQGGLISRKALVSERFDALNISEEIQLVTISAPFSGIAAAEHCGWPSLQVLSLGLVIPFCHIISGDKWYEITSSSPFIQEPGTLLPQIDRHVKIVTDERDSCRLKDKNGHCQEDDYVFSLAEQYFPVVDGEPRTENVELHAGHSEIVGDYQVVPHKLIDLLQQRGVMHQTAAQHRPELKKLLAQLYSVPAKVPR